MWKIRFLIKLHQMKKWQKLQKMLVTTGARPWRLSAAALNVPAAQPCQRDRWRMQNGRRWIKQRQSYSLLTTWCPLSVNALADLGKHPILRGCFATCYTSNSWTYQLIKTGNSFSMKYTVSLYATSITRVQHRPLGQLLRMSAKCTPPTTTSLHTLSHVHYHQAALETHCLLRLQACMEVISVTHHLIRKTRRSVVCEVVL